MQKHKVLVIFAILILSGLVILADPAIASTAAPLNSTFRLDLDMGLPAVVQIPHPNPASRLPVRENSQQVSSTIFPANSYRMETVKQYEERSYFLKDADFISDGTGWAVGEPHWVTETQSYTGTIIKTTDGGLTWSAEMVGMINILRSVDFVDADNGWAVGKNGTILHTSDGGIQWEPQNVPADIEFRYVFFLDAQIGWATGMRPIHISSLGDYDNWQASVWHTMNGGSTWITGTLPITASVLNRIDFIDAQNGWTVGYRFAGYDEFGDAIQKTLILHTHNGGQSWETQYAPDLGYYLTSVDFVDGQHGWAAGAPNTYSHDIGTVFRTSDGGQTWQNLPAVWGNFWDIHFLDVNRGYVVGLDYIGAAGPPVYRTFDGGDTWQRMDLEHEEMEGLFGLVVRENLVLALGDYDFVTRETEPWAPCDGVDCMELFTQAYINTHYFLKDVFFTDENNGWAVGARSFVPAILGQVILHTQDGGQTWNEQYSLTPGSLTTLFSYVYLNSVYFIDSQHGWAAGDSQYYYADHRDHYYLMYTSDGGQTWTERGSELYPEAIGIQLGDIQFTSPQEGWVLAIHGCVDYIACLAHTTDGGASWSWITTGQDGGDFIFDAALFFLDPVYGWIVGGLEDVYFTQDGGAIWGVQDPPTASNRLHDVAFINSQEGWIVGECFYHTTNGGAEWSVVDIGLQRDLNAIQFVDSQHGVMAGEWGNILFTDNSGYSWRWATNNVSISDLSGLYFLTPEKGWLVGDQGTILTTRMINVYEQFLPLAIHSLAE
jgi:photosystem II stability/assembly factor-like uncharacterized protein